MGLSTERFLKQPVNELCLCPICHDVLEEARQCPFGHHFCKSCILKWFTNSPTCPLDKHELSEWQLAPAAPFLLAAINDLELKCNFEARGCPFVSRSEDVAEHELNCVFGNYEFIAQQQISDLKELVIKLIGDQQAISTELINAKQQLASASKELDSTKLDLIAMQSQLDLMKSEGLTPLMNCMQQLADSVDDESQFTEVLGKVITNKIGIDVLRM